MADSSKNPYGIFQFVQRKGKFFLRNKEDLSREIKRVQGIFFEANHIEL